MTLPIRQVYQLARSAGLGHESAITATAIAMGESGLNPAAVGDTSLTDATWGPSIGLWQIRSVKSEKDTGHTRDAEQLSNPAFNARSMATISSGGFIFSPWTVWKNGSYRQYLPAVREAVGPGSAPATGATPVGWSAPDIPGPGDLLDLGGDVIGGIGGKAGDLAGAIVGVLVKEIGPAVLIGAGVLGGFAIIAIGAWRGSETAREAV